MVQQDNRIPLQPGQTISLIKSGTAEASGFRITEVVGSGSSCIVYSAVDCSAENNRIRLKEYYPARASAIRSSDGRLIVIDNEEFVSGMDRFRKSCLLQIRLRNTDALTNTTSSIQGIYEGNDTIYTVLTYNTGSSYDKITDTSLNYIFRIARAAALSLSSYHAQGLLHLDIKPANIFVMPESTEMVLLFDFDSIVSETEVQNEKGISLSFSRAWAAPELIKGKLHDISKKTDFYAIGAMIFERIYHRPAGELEQCSFASFSFDKSIPLFDRVNPKVFPELEKLFRHTLYVSPSRRYDSDQELIGQLELLIKLSEPDNHYFISFMPECRRTFIGREDELRQINAAFEKDHVLFLHGEGGIGKSEIARRYCVLNRKKYDTVLFITYENDLVSSLNQDENVCINAFYRSRNETPQELFQRKLSVMKKICRDKTLMIIDNYDTEHDENLSDILRLHCDILFTTRIDYSQNYPQINILPMPFETIMKMFESRGFSPDQENRGALSVLYQLYSGNTMVMRFLLDNMEDSFLVPADVLERLSSAQGKDSLSRDKLLQLYFRVIGFENINRAQKELALLIAKEPLVGIREDTLKSICGTEIEKNLKALIRRGFIHYSNTTKRITMHPVLHHTLQAFQNDDEIIRNDASLFTDAGMVLMQLSPEALKSHCARMYNSYKHTGIFKEYYDYKIKCLGDPEFNKILSKMKKQFLHLSNNEVPLLLYNEAMFVGKRGTVFTNIGIHSRCFDTLSTASISYKFTPYCDIIRIYCEVNEKNKDKIRTIHLLTKRNERIVISAFSRALSEFTFITDFLKTAVNTYPELLTPTLSSSIQFSSVQSVSPSGYYLRYFVRHGVLSAAQCEELTGMIDTEIAELIRDRRRYYTCRSKKFRKLVSHYPLKQNEIPILLLNHCFLMTNMGIFANEKAFLSFREIVYLTTEQFFDALVLRAFTDDGKGAILISSSHRDTDDVFRITSSCLDKMNHLLAIQSD